MTLDALRKSDIILICGLPGSGKSHFARRNPNTRKLFQIYKTNF